MYLRKRRLTARSAAAAVAALVVLAAAAVPAAAETEAGAPSEAEVPILEDLVFGPVETEVTHEAVAAPPGGSAYAAAGTLTCSKLRAYVKAYTPFTNSLAYIYNHEVHWCWDGDTITEVKQDYDYVTQAASSYYWRGNVTHTDYFDWWGGDSRGKYKTYREGEVERCLPIPQLSCITTYYPWMKITVYADGDNETRGSAG